MKDAIYIIVIVILVFILGYYIMKYKDKRRNDIIKLLVKKDLLPPDGQGNGWVEGGSCFMGDGTVGRVNGQYCVQTTVL